MVDMRRAHLLLLLLLLVVIHSPANGFQSFKLPEIPNFFKSMVVATTDRASQPSSISVEKKKQELIEAISNTNNGKTATPEIQAHVLRLVGEVERSAPPPLLSSNPEEIQALDGVWYLQYTSPSEEAGDDVDQFPNAWKPSFSQEKGVPSGKKKEFKARGTVRASGWIVDTSNRVVKQTFDMKRQRVTNEVTYRFGTVSVGGPFHLSDQVPNRAIVAFTLFRLAFPNGFQLDLSFVFSILSTIRGTKESGWLETTYLGNDLRIGRGNLGTMFVLTRDPNSVPP